MISSSIQYIYIYTYDEKRQEDELKGSIKGKTDREKGKKERK